MARPRAYRRTPTRGWVTYVHFAASSLGELRGITRTVGEIEWLLLILVLLF